MAKEEEQKSGSSNKPADKGKGKADDVKQVNGVNGTKEGKDGKKDDHDLPPEELSEEDQKLKDELDMLVERLTEDDTSLYKSALEAIKTSIKTSTSSMTAVPKPLKFLRPHYAKLCEAYERWPAGGEKDSLADTLSVLGMTYSDDEDRRDTLKYRLLAPGTDIGSWGHEYMRHLALEIGEEREKRLDEEQDTDDLISLTLSLVPFFLSHNAEADAVDILSELEMIESIKDQLDQDTYARVCLYMVSMVPLLTYPDNDRFLRTAHDIYVQYKQLTQAISLAIRLNDMDLIKADFASTSDKGLKRQLAFILARQRICFDLEGEDAEDQELQDCLNNTKLPEHFKSLAKELNVLDPKVPEDIYKSHLESSRTAGLTNTDSARHNLASAFVNAFVNAGFGQDKLMLVEGGVKQSWTWKVKEDGMLSTAASAGMLMLWDVEMGLDKIDAYTYVPENEVKAGASLAMGIMNSGVRLDSDPTMALLSDFEGKPTNVKVASIMGLGLAYAGSNKEDLLEVLLPLVTDTSLEMQISAMAALSLGLIFVGSAQSDVSEAIIQTFLDEDREKQLKDKWTRFMTLGLALLYFHQQEEVDVVLETLKAIEHPMSKPASVLAEICAWAGTGAVLKLQQLLHICNDHIEEKDSDDENKDEPKDDEKKKDEDGAEEKTPSDPATDQLVQAYAVIGLSLVAMGEDVGQEMVLRQFGHLMHYGEANIRKAVPLAMGLISPSNPAMKVYDTLSRYSHDNDLDVAVNAIFAMGMLGAGTNNARLAQLLRQLASYYHRDAGALFMVRIAQGLVHMGKGTLSLSPFHTDRGVLSRVACAGLLIVSMSLISDPKSFILGNDHYLLYYLVTAMHPRFLITLDEDLQPLPVSVRVGQAVDVVGQAGRPKTITGWQTQKTPVLLGYGERAELEDEEWVAHANVMEGVCILKKNPDWRAP
ncbi:proteasome regulatory particle base subunit [Vermiconidia calcicola]|uniref:Proteasome regulatory particle base subunit n=1 Tax=Vermiconidia calcicola TaxID=1690605 RepID=A0ACC3NGJ7_9PEZI|nr:proteasome regulatory particle base subunit [Vermiconidia calcicola]